MTNPTLPPDDPGLPGPSLNVGTGPAAPTISTWLDPVEGASPGLGRVMVSIAPPVPNAGSALFPSDSLIGHILDYALPTPSLTPVGLNLLEALTANDNSIWVGEDDDGGALGTEVAGTHLPGIGTVVAWIGEDRIIHAKLIATEVDHDGSHVTGLPEKQRLDDSLLASLGSAGLASGQGGGRLSVVATAKNTFTALWVADFGFTAALMGKAFTFVEPTQRQEAESQIAAATDFTASQLPPVRITGSIQNFDVAVTATGETLIKVVVTTEAGDMETSSYALGFNNGEAELTASQIVDNDDYAEAQSIAVVSDLAPATIGDTPVTPHTDAAGFEDVTETSVAPASSTASPLLVGAVNEPLTSNFDGGDGEIVAAPASGGNVFTTYARAPVALSNGGSAALNFEPGNIAGTSRLIIEITPADMPTIDQPRTVVVADNVITQEADRPDLDIAPVLESIGDDIAVSWVGAEEGVGGAAAVRTLNVGILTPPPSHPSDGEPVMEVVTLLTTTELISDIDLAGQGTPSASTQWTLAWVQNADTDGYGSLNLRTIHRRSDDERDGDSSDRSLPPTSPTEQGGADSAIASPTSENLAAPSAGELPAPSAGEIVSEIAAYPSDTAYSGHSPWISSKSNRLIDERARAPDVSVVAEGAIAVSWLSKGTSEDIGNTVHIMLVSNELETVHRFDLNTQSSDRIDGKYGPQIATNGEGDFLVGWLREAGDGYEAVAVTVHYAADVGWVMQPRPVVVATFEKDPKDLQFRALEERGETHLVVQWKDSGDTHQHTLDFVDFDFGNSDADVSQAQTVAVLAPESASASNNRGSSQSDEPIATTIAVTIDEHSDVILFHDTSETTALLLGSSNSVLSSSDFGAAVVVLSELPAVVQGTPESASQPGWDEAQSIDDIIGAMGGQFMFSADGLASGSTLELTTENDNSDGPEANDTIETAFDALQFANVLNASANADVMTFDAAGFVQLKDFDPI